jgi:hypothetical protein
MEMVRAPFTDEQLANIRDWQTAGIVHEYMCELSGATVLEVHREGLKCGQCGYTQTHVLAGVADGSMLKAQRETMERMLTQ